MQDKHLIQVDGRIGEGGGQVVRSSLTLSAVTGQALRLTDIRGGRTRPGLLRQHLTGLRAIAQICSAKVDGDTLGSIDLSFEPSSIIGGTYQYEVGSAGSAVLVAQTILPALIHADEPSHVTIGGGTHASWAPPYDFFERCYLPLLRRMGADVTCEIITHGFYPAGGGQMQLHVQPTATLTGLNLIERGALAGRDITALVSRVPINVAQRECDVIKRRSGWTDAQYDAAEVTSIGPGNAVMIRLDHQQLSELFIGFGKQGVRAENVARNVLRQAKRYLSHDAPVGEYLADQLMLPMGLAASSGHSSVFRTPPLTPHSTTHVEILQRFLGIEVAVEVTGVACEVTITPRR